MRKIISVLILTIILISTSMTVSLAADITDLLTFEEISFQTPEAITEDLALIKKFYEWDVSWESKKDNIIDTDGHVTRPMMGEDSVTVELVATLTNGTSTKYKSFIVTVLPIEDEKEILEKAKYTLTFENLSQTSSGSAYGILTLPSRGAYNTLILWESSDDGIIKIVPDGENYKGIISNAYWGDGIYNTALTATIMYKNEFVTKQFYITTAEKESIYIYSDTMQSVLNEFDLNFKKENSVLAIRKDLVLPKYDTVQMSFKSSDESVISNDGVVTRAYDKDNGVSFSVTFKNGYEKAVVLYWLNVKAVESDTISNYLEEDVAWAINQIKGNNSIANISTNLTLPEEGPNGSKLTWTSSNEGAITSKGVITRGTSDVDVVLTVRASYSKEYKEEALTIRIKAISNIIPPPTSGGGGGSSGGGISPTTRPPIVEDTDNTVFSDVPRSHWSYDAVMSLYNKGIINGVSDGYYAPDTNITREAFVKILVQASGLEVKEYAPVFEDVRPDEWYYNYISTAEAHKIVNGIGDSLFGIGESITRQDIFTIIARAFYPDEKAQSSPVFSDFYQAKEYSQNSIALLAEKGIIKGDENACNPNGFASRAEVAAVIYRVINAVK